MRKCIGILIFVLGALFSLSAQQCNHRGSHPTMRTSAENLRSDTIDVLSYTIELDITDFSGHIIDGSTAVKFRPRMNNVQTLSLDLLAMNIDSIELNATNLTYSYNDTLIVVDLGSTFNVGDTLTVKVFYRGIPQMDPSGWGGFYWSGGYAFNLGVGFQSIPHNYGRVWHPCFDNFVERATYDMTIKTNGGKRAYCNGYLVSENISGSDIYRHWKLDTPIPSYLACVNVAAYTHVEQNYVSPLTGFTTPMWLTALPADTTNMKASFSNLDLAMEAFEYGYGPYLWNKVGFSLVPFSSGAMEHATNIAYPLATITGGLQYETLMAHELSHHWWGDLVTCSSAEHMWINEGMASYSERLFLEYVYDYQSYIDEVRANHKQVIWKAHIEDTGYWALNAVPLNVTYGSTSYNKGSDVAHTLRGYLGDSLFFLGLKTIIANNQHQNISSEDFRDQLNAIPGIDVTDFFEGWVLNPGFPEFSIDSIELTSGGPSYSADVYVRQKLRGAPAYFNNVPLTLTFRDADWNTYQERIVVSGQNSVVTVTLPFVPVQWTLNEDDKISDAVTGDNLVIKSNGLKLLSHSNFQFNVYGVTDSALVRVEQHWVAPDDFSGANFMHVISPDRFWRLTGVDFENIYSTAKLNYNGTSTGAGYLDRELMVNHGSVAFNEDSLVLFWRPSPEFEWTEYPYYTRQTQASKTDKVGSITMDSVRLGDYAFGMRIGFLGVNDHSEESMIRLFPNPSSDRITIEYNGVAGGDTDLVILDIRSRIVYSSKMDSDRKSVDLSRFEKGNYIVQLQKNGKTLAGKKLVIR